MRKIYLLILFAGYSISCWAQVDSLHENFNTVCATAGSLSDGDWIEYNAIPPFDSLAWNCTPTFGKGGTPGMRCMGYYSGAYHKDTAWLFTPALAVYSFSDSVYLRFDSKYEVGYGVGAHKSSLSIFVLRDTFSTAFLYDTSINLNVSITLAPVIGASDSMGWVTHQLNLYPYRSYPSIRVAWRYVSDSVDAGAWTIDNVNTSQIPLALQKSNVNYNTIQLSANYKNDQLNLSLYTPGPGDYQLAVYDITGRELLKQDIAATGGKEAINLDKMQYKKGLYILKMWNSREMSVAKVIVY